MNNWKVIWYTFYIFDGVYASARIDKEKQKDRRKIIRGMSIIYSIVTSSKKIADSSTILYSL